MRRLGVALAVLVAVTVLVFAVQVVIMRLDPH
jgi:hypothetical protein